MLCLPRQHSPNAMDCLFIKLSCACTHVLLLLDFRPGWRCLVEEVHHSNANRSVLFKQSWRSVSTLYSFLWRTKLLIIESSHCPLFRHVRNQLVLGPLHFILPPCLPKKYTQIKRKKRELKMILIFDPSLFTRIKTPFYKLYFRSSRCHL